MAKKISALAYIPDFTWDTRKNRGDWSTKGVSARIVVLNPEQDKPD